MREFKASTKAGQRILAMSDNCIYSDLSQVYKSWSSDKQKAFNWCISEFCKDEGTSFGIGNANTFGFTASWCLVVDGESAIRVETKNNSYLVWLDR